MWTNHVGHHNHQCPIETFFLTLLVLTIMSALCQTSLLSGQSNSGPMGFLPESVTRVLIDCWIIFFFKKAAAIFRRKVNGWMFGCGRVCCLIVIGGVCGCGISFARVVFLQKPCLGVVIFSCVFFSFFVNFFAKFNVVFTAFLLAKCVSWCFCAFDCFCDYLTDVCCCIFYLCI